MNRNLTEEENFSQCLKILTQITIEDENELAEREVFPKTINERILRQWQQTYLEKLLYLLQCFFFLQGPTEERWKRLWKDTVPGFQNTPALHKRAKTYSALSFHQINFFNMANLFSISRKHFVVCYCFCEPIKTFFFDACQMTVKSRVLHLFPAPQTGRNHIVNIILASFFRGPYCKLRILVFSIDLWPAWFALGP